jgi:S1-C subfamily serine protease
VKDVFKQMSDLFRYFRPPSGLSAFVGVSFFIGSSFVSAQPVLDSPIVIPQPLPSTSPPNLVPLPGGDVISGVIVESPTYSSVAPASASTSIQQKAFKPILPDKRSASQGMTLVSLESGLDRILRGSEPRNLEELQALEKQQAKVASLIQQVTVNVQQGSAQGSGVVITADGYVLTAAHVAGKPNRAATIILPDGRRVQGRTMGMNRDMDAGLIKITDTAAQGWSHASLGTSSDLKLGQWVVAAGHPGGWMGDRPAVIRVGRLLKIMKSTLCTDCALIGGDSGGPLFDIQGKLVGVHSRIGTDIDENMHVPVDVYSDNWTRLAKGDAWGVLPGYRPVIGIGGDKTEKAVVASLAKDGPADKAGIRVGDVIRKFDNLPIASFEDLQRAVESTLPGDRAVVEVDRQGAIIQITVVVGVLES